MRARRRRQRKNQPINGLNSASLLWTPSPTSGGKKMSTPDVSSRSGASADTSWYVSLSRIINLLAGNRSDRHLTFCDRLGGFYFGRCAANVLDRSHPSLRRLNMFPRVSFPCLITAYNRHTRASYARRRDDKNRRGSARPANLCRDNRAAAAAIVSREIKIGGSETSLGL